MKEYTVKVFDDRKEWFQGGVLHREDGPAVEYLNGTNFWYLNNELHREDGPAVEYLNGYKAWFLNNEKHRRDGPAIEFPDGRKEWWINGIEYTEEKFNEIKNRKSKEDYLNLKRSLNAEQVLDEELVMCHLGTLESFQSPYDALQEIISFYIGLEQYNSQNSEN